MTYYITSTKGLFAPFIIEDEGLGYLQFNVVERIQASLLQENPKRYLSHEGVKKDALVHIDGDDGGPYEFAFRDGSSMDYLRRPGKQVSLHPFDKTPT